MEPIKALANPQTAEAIQAMGNDPALNKYFELAKGGGTCDTSKQGIFFLKKDLLYCRLDEDPTAPSQLVAPTPYHKQVLEMGHSAILSDHTCLTGTKARIRQHYSWPVMTEDISRFVHSCHQ